MRGKPHTLPNGRGRLKKRNPLFRRPVCFPYCTAQGVPPKRRTRFLLRKRPSENLIGRHGARARLCRTPCFMRAWLWAIPLTVV
ncbi:hypothetical protein [Kingella potus]|uniref:hypothetical protein n=1 Tax=Kingella potus TaxID=265175 RepID=UPI001FD2E09F|nr:hypothetical protein [Kingella potus]UOP01181.1 hypothetical protein LVJ84_02400 [Kingella potus]